jgi:hypothetical protein
VNVGRTKCDFDADGYDDIAISAYPNYSSVAGAIHFYYGSTETQFDTTNSNTAFNPLGRDNGFGISISCAGDVDGDGYADVLTGAPYANRAYVYRGGARDRVAREHFTIEGNSQGYLGSCVASAGDVNGDGFGDVIIGTLNITTAYLYLGGPSGLGTRVPLGRGGSDPNAAATTSSAGDVNGDGYSDVLISLHSQNTTTVQVYHGNPGQGFDSTPKTELAAPSNDSEFGFSISAAGDINGDGFGDIIIGAWKANQAYLYLGGPQGLKPNPDITLTGNSGFGYTVAAAGDINNDGFEDIAVTDGAERALIYLGQREPEPGEPDIAIYKDAREQRTGQRLGSPGDINGDGYSDLTLAIAEDDIVYVYTGDLAIATPATESTSISQTSSDREFGFAVAHR